jgi:trigger factor
VSDIAIIDFQGFDGGTPIPQVKGVNTSVDVGSGRNNAEFEGKLVGLRKGEEATIEVSFPLSTPNPVMAGKNIEFKVTVRDVKERVLAELDDEFAKDVGEQFNTIALLREDILTKLKQQKEEAAAGDLADKLMKALIDKHDFEVPGRLVQYEIDDYIKQTEQRLEANGLNFKAAGINKEEMASHYRPVAEKRVRGDFILKKIAEQEGIKLEEADINKGFNRIATQYNMSIDEVKGYFKRREDMLPFLNELLNEKILQMLQDEAKYVIIPAEKAEKSSAAEHETGDKA